MNNKITQAVARLRVEKTKRRRLLSIVTALGVLVGGNVFWELRSIGTAMTDPDADPAYLEETPAVDELTAVPLEEHPPDTDPALSDLTGMTRKEMIARLAEAQCGEAESLTDFETDPETGQQHGVTRYGTWYNNPYGAWNTMFACWCLYNAGAEEIPCGSGCWAWSVSLAEAGLLLPADTVPERGDVLLLDTDLDEKADRCGIVTAVTEEELTVVEGDLDDAVGVCSYPAGDERILGYIAAENAAVEMTAESAEPPPEETPLVVTFHESSASGITVDVEAPEEAFPAGTFMTVSDVSHEEALQAANGAEIDTETLDAVAVDITFWTAEGEETEPAADVAVQITLPETQQMPDGELSLLHVTGEGTVETVDAEIAENMVTFTAESFSIYVVTVNGTKDTNSLIMANGQPGNNSQTNPYVLYIGETLDVYYEGQYLNSGGFSVYNNGPDDNKIIERTANGGDTLSGNQRKAEFYGRREGTCCIYYMPNKEYDFNNTDGKLWVQVVEPSVYMVMSDGSRLEIHRALEELNKAKLTDPLVIYAVEGETFTLSVDGGAAHLIGFKDWDSYMDEYDLSEYLHRGAPDFTGGNTAVTFTCLKHGTTTITVNGLQIEVIISHPMYVVDNLHDRDIDRINEWVSTSGWTAKRGGYTPNAPGYFPYQLYDDDLLHLRIPTSDIEGAYIQIGNDTILSLVSGAVTPNNGEINITLQAHNTTDEDRNTTVVLKDRNGTVIRTMNVRVPHRTKETLDHADIEIADGGKYTVTKLVRNTNGTVEKIVTEYRAYVSGVNSSTLYSSSDDTQPCDFYYNASYFKDTNGNTYTYAQRRNDKWYVNDVEVTEQDVTRQYDDSGKMNLTRNKDVYENGVLVSRTKEEYQENVRTGITGYLSGDYWVDPTIPKGSPQYELTSKYNLDTGHWSNIRYYPAEVDHVVFDVKLGLEPSKVTTYTLNANGEWVQSSSTTITDGTTEEIPSVLFNMDHQDVLDAYNKCPNHSGLDFTIMANSALVEFDLNKELTGGTIQENQFEFMTIQPKMKLLRTWAGQASTEKSIYKGLDNNGLEFEGMYRLFYNDGQLHWGNGVDGDAVLAELQTIPSLQYLQNVDAVFNVANSDENADQKAVLEIIRRHLLLTDYTETDTSYTAGHDGLYLALEYDPVQIVSNDEHGIVTFDALHFEKPGTYHFLIQEKGGDQSNILYDNTCFDLEIKVTKDEDNQLVADILSDVSTFEFINHTTFTLPSTGGSGTLPYLVAGGGLVAAALLLYKRRKEVQQ